MIKQLSIAFILLMLLAYSSCIKPDDPCHGARHVKADFYMEEFCSGDYCGQFWKDYKTDICSSGWMRFSSTNDSTATFEWHIGAGVYHGHKLELNFGSVAQGTTIPIMLIVKQKPNPLCIPNDNGIDTLIKTLKIDRTKFLFYGRWQGFYLDHPNDIRYIKIDTITPPLEFTWMYISGIEPLSTNDSTTDSYRDTYRQEFPFIVHGNGTFNFYGNVLTDSIGQNIEMNYSYRDTPNTIGHNGKIIYKTFKGHKI